MNILIIGDICGSPGRQATKKYIEKIKIEYGIDFVIANGENSAGGVGITKPVLDELYSLGIDVVTTGNHIWDKKDVFEFIEEEPYLVRPANYPQTSPGQGFCIYDYQSIKIGIINISGRTFMPALDCPFQVVDTILAKIKTLCDIIIVDFHAEATSEKMAMGWYLDGKVSAVVGTHTHIQTADERILTKGTGYITDLGMVGPWNSILGVEKEIIINKFITALPTKFNLAKGPNVFSAVVLKVDETNGECVDICRILLKEEEKNI